MNEYTITNCLCFNKENEHNCSAETLGCYCQDNHKCPIRLTYEVTQDNKFEIEYLDAKSPKYDIYINNLIDIAKEEK